MNRLIAGFKGCAHQAGERCRLANGLLVRRFGLGDFLENKLAETDSAADIAVKALEFFCEKRDPHSDEFRFLVLTVVTFLDEHHSGHPCDSLEDLQQPMRDLISLLTKSANEAQFRRWIESRFSE